MKNSRKVVVFPVIFYINIRTPEKGIVRPLSDAFYYRGVIQR